MKKRLLIFHKAIAPYRIDFFNSLNSAFETRICPSMDHMVSQSFDYGRLKKLFEFEPHYLLERYNLGIGKVPKGVVSQLREWNPDIVFVSEYGAVAIIVIIYKLLTRKNYKIVSICDDSYNMLTENNDFKMTHKLARKLIAPFIDELILVEPLVVDWYMSHYGKGYWFPIIVPDDKAEAMYSRLKERSRQEMVRYNIEDKNVFLFVGRLVKIKNVISAIDAISKLNQDENVLVVIGDGVERASLESHVKERGTNVLFLGRLEGDELNLWYNIAHVFVLPSYQEPFGAVTNEALLAGCWCLVSNKAGSRCLIENGKNGYTFDPYNIEDLSEKMKQSVDIFKQELTSTRKNRMLKKYNESINGLISHLNEI